MLDTSLSDLEIGHAAQLLPIEEVAASAGVQAEHLETYGRYIAKVAPTAQTSLADRAPAKYVVITAVTPTPLGEGKTTTSIGLAQGLSLLGHRSMLSLRQPSLGPTFGIKGGAAGAGYSQVVPMEAVNLHLTGDFHAVTSAHNMLTAMVDNHLHHGNELDIDVRTIAWRRVMDVNDRSLRNVVVGLGERMDGLPRQAGFDITAASEVMVILSLSTSLRDLRERLGRHRSRTPAALWQVHRQGRPDSTSRPVRPGAREVRRHHRGDTHSPGRGQDHHRDRACSGPVGARASVDALAAPALARADVRHQGRCGRRRL